MEIEHGDTLIWDVDKKNDEKIIVVRKKEEE